MIAGFCFACSPNVVERITWLEPEVDTSGFPGNYVGTRLQYHGLAKMGYVLSNDSDNLYLCLRIPDEHIQMQIMLAGMSICVDSGKKAFHERGIAFPLPGELGKKHPQPGVAEQKDKTTRRKEFLLQQGEFEIWGFNESGSGRMRRSDTSGIKVRMEWDSLDVLVYEAVIPLSEIYHSTGTSLDTNAVFNLGVIINELALPSGPPGGGPGREGMPGGGMPGGGMPGGGMPGGGRPGGGMPGGGMPGADLTEKKSFQYVFKLSFNETLEN